MPDHLSGHAVGYHSPAPISLTFQEAIPAARLLLQQSVVAVGKNDDNFDSVCCLSIMRLSRPRNLGQCLLKLINAQDETVMVDAICKLNESATMNGQKKQWHASVETKARGRASQLWASWAYST